MLLKQFAGRPGDCFKLSISKESSKVEILSDLSRYIESRTTRQASSRLILICSALASDIEPELLDPELENKQLICHLPISKSGPESTEQTLSPSPLKRSEASGFIDDLYDL
jgi:hypothetical protein